MTALQTQAALSEPTVQRVAKGEATTPRRRTRASEGRPRTTQARVQRLHPLVLEAAQRVVETGTYSRIDYVDDTTALVR